MLSSLVRLVTQLSNQFGIDVTGVTQDDAHSYYNLAGHRDFNYTSCPGTNVYRLLPTLRSEVARSVRSEATLLGAGIAERLGLRAGGRGIGRGGAGQGADHHRGGSKYCQSGRNAASATLPYNLLCFLSLSLHVFAIYL